MVNKNIILSIFSVFLVLSVLSLASALPPVYADITTPSSNESWQVSKNLTYVVTNLSIYDNITVRLYNSTKDLLRKDIWINVSNPTNTTLLSDGVYYLNATSELGAVVNETRTFTVTIYTNPEGHFVYPTTNLRQTSKNVSFYAVNDTSYNLFKVNLYNSGMTLIANFSFNATQNVTGTFANLNDGKYYLSGNLNNSYLNFATPMLMSIEIYTPDTTRITCTSNFCVFVGSIGAGLGMFTVYVAQGLPVLLLVLGFIAVVLGIMVALGIAIKSVIRKD
jgi:hypothetical protein